MQVALLASMGWLDDELMNYRTQVVGLIDEQVRVAQVVPAELPIEDATGFAEHVPWHESRWELLNRYRLRRLQTVLSKLRVDLVHAMDLPVWHGALWLAQAMDVPAVININVPNDLRTLIHLMRTADPCAPRW